MTSRHSTHYDILGVGRDAKNTDITRAYRNLVRANQRDEVPPDARRDARIEEAYRVLCDEQARELYDRSLVARKTRNGAKILGASLLSAALVAVAVVLYLRSAVVSPPKGRSLQELSADASRSVGRVRSVDVSGKTVDTGLAFAISDTTLATTCAGLAPGAQILVRMPSRDAPARLTDADPASGLCKLTVDGGAGWPLPLGGRGAPRPGEKVYATYAAASGAVALIAGTVRQVRDDSRGRVIEVAMDATAAAEAGGPLLDARGRVVGVAAVLAPEGPMHHVALPASWTKPKASQPRADSDATTPAAPRATEPPAEGKEEARRKLRPEPKLPPDL